MPTITIELDASTDEALRQLSRAEGDDLSTAAARLLARTVRAARPRPAFPDADALRAAYATFQDEDQSLAESALTERADLLCEDDRA